MIQITGAFKKYSTLGNIRQAKNFSQEAYTERKPEVLRRRGKDNIKMKLREAVCNVVYWIQIRWDKASSNVMVKLNSTSSSYSGGTNCKS